MIAPAKKFGIALLSLVILAGGLFVYYQHNQKQSPVGQLNTSPSATVTIVDTIGRSVQVPQEVKRVACLYAFSGHVATMLDQGRKIVAVPDGLHRDVLLNQICPSIGKAVVPVQSGSINIEELLKAKPDLVFLQKETALNQSEVEKLNQFHIPYLVVDFGSIQEQQKAIKVIGQALGASERAQEYNTFYQNCVDRVEKVVREIPPNKRVRVYHSINEATRTDIVGSLPADWMQRTGAVNVALDQPLRLVEGKYYASLEQLMVWNPDLILANEPGVASYITSNPQWASMKAVKDQKVYQMPIGISRWGHPGGLETPLAMLWTAQLLYPGYCKDIDIEAETQKFYQQFFHVQLDQESIEQILSGHGMRLKKGQTNQ
ncbi:MAG TPA: ABC transporter substrate-binding protein [Syntrophomonadaceae bacterium]|nr:ABC transporter substrate-binding protein [Syntrophomonadaceae bacterium]